MRRPGSGGPAGGPDLQARLAAAAAAISEPFEMSAERAAALLDERARALAAPPKPAQAAELREFVIFRIGKAVYGLEGRYVQTVARLGLVVAVPGLPDAFLGITSLRGLLLPLIDLRIVLDLPRGRPVEANRMLVVGRDSAELGIAVDSIEELASFPLDNLAKPPGDTDPGAASCIHGVTPDRVVLLDASSLLDAPRLRVGRPQAASL